MSNQGRGLRLAGRIVLITAVLFFCVAAFLTLQAQRFLSKAARAEGEVVRMVTSGSGASPVFRFTTAAGAVIEVRSDITSDPPAWRVGERTAMLYSPDDPQNAAPDSFFATWLFPLVFLAVGFAELIAAIVLLTLAKRRMPAS